MVLRFISATECSLFLLVTVTFCYTHSVLLCDCITLCRYTHLLMELELFPVLNYLQCFEQVRKQQLELDMEQQTGSK